MFVTDGLSEGWDPELRSPEEEPWGFELTKEEYEFAMQIQGSARSEELAKKFIAGKDRHLSDPSRKSIIH
ncbi:MAG: hypothetical protein JKY56_12410 [Kofleriaceae bacterium]|nr:hypothetical protein [Kofleriaceae bacterium]